MKLTAYVVAALLILLAFAFGLLLSPGNLLKLDLTSPAQVTLLGLMVTAIITFVNLLSSALTKSYEASQKRQELLWDKRSQIAMQTLEKVSSLQSRVISRMSEMRNAINGLRVQMFVHSDEELQHIENLSPPEKYNLWREQTWKAEEQLKQWNATVSSDLLDITVWFNSEALSVPIYFLPHEELDTALTTLGERLKKALFLFEKALKTLTLAVESNDFEAILTDVISDLSSREEKHVEAVGEEFKRLRALLARYLQLS